MRRKLLSAAAFLVLSGALAGCAGGYSYGYVAYGPPPPVAYGAIGVAPGPGFVWIDGYHAWRGGRYEWVPGRWARSPRPGVRWVPGAWRHEARGWRYHEGRWR